MVDTSTEAVEKLLDGVTPGPWGFFQGEDDAGNAYFGVTAGTGDICSMSNAYEWRGRQTIANARFLAAARDLVPALLADRDALMRENENLRQIERNVQAVREHEYKRAEAALAEIERLNAELSAIAVSQPATVQDAAKVPDVKALVDAAKALHIDMLERAECRMDTIRGEQYRIVNSGRTAWANFDAALRAIADGRA